MYDDPNTESQEWDDDSVGTSQDAEANLEGESEPNTDTDDDPDAYANPEDQGNLSSVKTQEELRLERIAAIREAENNRKKEMEAREEGKFYKTALKVGKNPQKLKGIYRDDPQLAERIAQEVWGSSYEDVASQLGGQESSSSGHSLDEDSIRSLLREEMTKTERQKEAQKIEDLEVDFTLRHNLDPKSATYRNVMDKYRKYKPKTSAEAQELLEMAYTHVTGKGISPAPRKIGSAAVPLSRGGFVREKPAKRSVSPAMRAFMEKQYGKDHTDKFLKG